MTSPQHLRLNTSGCRSTRIGAGKAVVVGITGEDRRQFIEGGSYPRVILFADGFYQSLMPANEPPRAGSLHLAIPKPSGVGRVVRVKQVHVGNCTPTAGDKSVQPKREHRRNNATS